ncbi:MAG: YdcF family protein, partial [Mesorhizobium sp.]
MPVVGARAHGRGNLARLAIVLRIFAFSVLALAALFAGGFGWFASTVSHM